MAVIDQLQVASFRGVEFLVASESSSSGKKVVSHEYPGANRRYSEELGEIPPKFSIEAVVHGDINARLAFEAALKRKGLGALVHPIYGTVNVMVSTYVVSSRQTAVGEFRFQVSFETSAQNITASVEALSKTEVASAAGIARASVLDAFEEAYIPPTTVETYTTVRDRVSSVIDRLDAASKKIVDPVQASAAKITRVISDFRRRVNTIAQSGVQIRAAFDAVYLEISNAVNTPADLYDVWSDLINVGYLPGDEVDVDLVRTKSAPAGVSPISLPDPVLKTGGFGSVPYGLTLPYDTSKRSEIADNVSAVDSHVRLIAIAGLIESAAYRDPLTDADLSEIKAAINTSFDTAMQDLPALLSAYVRAPDLSSEADVRGDMYDLWTIGSRVLDRKSGNLWTITDVDPVHITSPVLLTYRYLGDLDNLGTVQALNPGLSAAGGRKETVKMVI